MLYVLQHLSNVIRRRGPLRLIRKVAGIFYREGLTGIGWRVRNVFAGARQTYTYHDWIVQFDSYNDEDDAIRLAKIAAMPNPPKLSIITPVYNTPERWLRSSLDSILAQLYPHWELCLADDASTKPHVREVLEEYRARDPRIKVVYRSANGHISAASNSALELATGEFCVLFDHDDMLPKYALYWVAEEIVAHPDCALIYSDEDKITVKGERFEPYFKPDWNPDLFLSHNLISHLGVYRTSLVRQVGGFRVGLEGSQDHDLALRCVEQVKPRQIRHIPRVLYHWRMIPGSTAIDVSEKPFAVTAGQRAIRDHLARLGIAADVDEALIRGMYRVRYHLPDPPPLVSLIMPTRNGLALVKQALDSIFAKTTYPAFEVIVIDNGSDDRDTLAYLAEQQQAGRIRVLRDERPFNFSALNNHAVRTAARGNVLGFINNDIEVISPDWLSELVSHALRPSIGAAGARLLYPNNTIQHAGVVLIGGVAGHAFQGLQANDAGFCGRAFLIQDFSAVTAAAMVMRREVFDAVDGFDESLEVAFNDVDLCLRLNAAGYYNIWTPYAELYHHESATRGKDASGEKKARFLREVAAMQQRYGKYLHHDPCYSPNLTLNRNDFGLSFPPRVPRNEIYLPLELPVNPLPSTSG